MCAYHGVIFCYCYCSGNKEAVSQEEIKKYQMITDDADLELILSVAESLHAGERNVSPVGKSGYSICILLLPDQKPRGSC